MAKDTQSKGWFAERKRKFFVSIKRRPHNIPLVFMAITFMEFSFNLTSISNTTAVVNKSNMGICAFGTMLLSVLAFVVFLNAFPKRQKPKTVMVILLYAMDALIIFCDIIYIMRINEGLLSIDVSTRQYIPAAKNVLIIHIVLMVITIVLTACIPLMKKGFAKINTSIEVAGNEDIGNIELSEDQRWLKRI